MGYPRVSLSLEDWPPRDRQLWNQANAAVGPLDTSGRAAWWTPKTRNQVGKDYGRFLFWLRAEQRLDDVHSPAIRLTRENLAGYLEHLQATGMASTSLLSRVRNLRQAVRAMDPTADLRLISLLCSKLKARAEPTRDKHLRVVPSVKLADAAFKEYDDTIGGGKPVTAREWYRSRDALMMGFLAYLPLRLDNFAGLRIGQHLVRCEQGYLLSLGADEAKEHRPYACLVPEALVPYLDHYVNTIRPRLLHGKTSDRLWVSMRGTGLSGSAVYYQINKITRRLIGHALNPHAFRDCLMTSIATDAPASVRAGARILGHRDLRTGEAHYNFAGAIAAQRTYFAILRAKRARVADGPERRGRHREVSPL